MTRAVASVRPLLAALLLAAGSIAWAAAPAEAASIDPNYDFCAGPQSIVAIGTGGQASVHNTLGIPKYNAACPAADGDVSYVGNGDAAAVDAAIYHTHLIMASDVPLSSQNKQFAENYTCCTTFDTSTINQMPVYVDGLSVAYNLGSCPSTSLKLKGTVLALIYSGEVTQWNDKLIVDDNPQLATCNLTIRPAVRYDVAGSTAVFKDYLSKWDPAFAPFTNELQNQSWPPTFSVGCRGIGEPGMATCLGVSGAIGYIQYKQAVTSGLPSASMQNLGNTFSKPAPTGTGWPTNCQAAASAAVTPPSAALDWSAVSITNPRDGYPICTFSYVWAFQRPRLAHRWSSQYMAYTAIDYLYTLFSSAVQNNLTSYGVAPLPAAIRDISLMGVDTIRWD